MDNGDIFDMSDDELLRLPRPPCPACGSTDRLVPHIYGLPSSDDPLVERAERGEVDVEFAGCIIPTGHLPMWRCRACDALVAIDGSRVDEADLYDVSDEDELLLRVVEGRLNEPSLPWDEMNSKDDDDDPTVD